ncbi:MAG: hypothetical protein IKD89_01200 [Clostridia bacterium]|nr:hypothetical protein [Clostridia bacterium]
MNIWRVQLKPSPAKGLGPKDVLRFCMEQGIIGVGWAEVECAIDDYYTLRDAVHQAGYGTNAIKAINAIRQMQSGDLVWTRLGGDASEYYLCKVGKTLWKDRVVTPEHVKHDIANFVFANWLHIGKEDAVPGKVIASFRASGTAQRVYAVEEVSKYIWDSNCQNESERYGAKKPSEDSFWNMISSEDLECLILLYLQSKGYYIYSSTLKRDTPKYEAILIASDGSHRAFPQIKQNTRLVPGEYIEGLQKSDRVYLFSSSESYGKPHPQVTCITKEEVNRFISSNYGILPSTITRWLKMTSTIR